MKARSAKAKPLKARPPGLGELGSRERLGFRLHGLAARLGLGGRARMTLRPDGKLLRLETADETLVVPSALDWRRYAEGIGAAIEASAALYAGPAPVGPGQVVVDVGAGVGLFTLYAARAGATVFAVEPDPVVFDCLEANTARDPRIHRVKTVCWSDDGEITFHCRPATGTSSVFAGAGPALRKVQAPAQPLDLVLGPWRPEVIDLLKIDVGGVEAEVLNGAAETLARTRRAAIGAAADRAGGTETIIARLEAAGFAVERQGDMLHARKD